MECARRLASLHTVRKTKIVESRKTHTLYVKRIKFNFVLLFVLVRLTDIEAAVARLPIVTTL